MKTYAVNIAEYCLSIRDLKKLLPHLKERKTRQFVKILISGSVTDIIRFVPDESSEEQELFRIYCNYHLRAANVIADIITDCSSDVGFILKVRK